MSDCTFNTRRLKCLITDNIHFYLKDNGFSLFSTFDSLPVRFFLKKKIKILQKKYTTVLKSSYMHQIAMEVIT